MTSVGALSVRGGGGIMNSLRSSALLLVLLVVGCLLVLHTPTPMSMVGRTLQRQGPVHKSPEQLCSHLQGTRAAGLCDTYASALGSHARFAAAIAWKQTEAASYACAGINADCLHTDLAAARPGSSCAPLPQGTECSPGKHCSHGYCGGLPQEQEEPEDLQAADDERPVPRLLATSASLDKPIAAWPTTSATVTTSQMGLPVSDTFLATSHEYTRIADYGDPRMAHAWGAIFKMMAPSPIIRIGGASQDAMTKVPGPEVWKALKLIQKNTNCRFIFGLPLWPKNSIEMSKQIIADSQKHLGSNSIVSYELGNEPEFWPTGLGGYDKNGKWQKGFEAYADWFKRVATAINPCKSGIKLLSGPGWGNVNTQPVNWAAKVMYDGKDCYLKELNIHYYPYINNETVTASELLAQPLQDFGLSKFGEYNRIASKEKLGIRISETNSLYGGGRANLSDTLVGALWVADALFAFSSAGAKAFHLHWGLGGHPSGTLGQPNTGVQTNFHFDVSPGEPPVPWPSVHAPWYGYLLWIVAASGDYGQHTDTRFVSARFTDKGKCGANMKVWALRANSGDLRVVFINKDQTKDCNVKLELERAYCTSRGQLTRLLPGPLGLLSKGGITWQGQSYERDGNIHGQLLGKKVVQDLKPQTLRNGVCGFEVPIPLASAGLFIIKRG